MTRRSWGGRRVQRLRRAIYTRDRGICGICGRPASFDDGHVDHVIPRTAGGTDRSQNLRWTHRSCNLSKGARGGTPVPVPRTEGADLPVSLPDARTSRVW
jgi:5-methylcytosine-specific restriction endonuclease McrA